MTKGWISEKKPMAFNEVFGGLPEHWAGTEGQPCATGLCLLHSLVGIWETGAENPHSPGWVWWKTTIAALVAVNFLQGFFPIPELKKKK